MFEDERGRKEEMEEKCEGERYSPSNRAAPATSGLLPSSTGNRASLPLTAMISPSNSLRRLLVQPERSFSGR